MTERDAARRGRDDRGPAPSAAPDRPGGAAGGAGRPGRARAGYVAALLGGLAGMAVLGLAAWLHDAFTPLAETTLTMFGFQLLLVMAGPFAGASVGAALGLRLRGHGGAWATAGVAALLSVPAAYLAWFVLLDLPWVPFAAIPALIAVLPLLARAVVLGAGRGGRPRR